jgi:hypothetical protein
MAYSFQAWHQGTQCEWPGKAGQCSLMGIGTIEDRPSLEAVMTPFFKPFTLAATLAAVTWLPSASNAAPNKEEKTVTVISAEGKFDGRSEISRETVKDCIAALPDPSGLEPEVTSENIFLREINGDANKNEWVRVYTAKLEVHYLQTKKEMLVVTTRSVQGQEPVFKEIDKSLHQSKAFMSDPANGDLFAGRSKRQYYFAKPEDAVKDVRERAKSWINQHKAVLCQVGGAK